MGYFRGVINKQEWDKSKASFLWKAETYSYANMWTCLFSYFNLMLHFPAFPQGAL